MKVISFRFPTSIRDIKVLWKEYISKRYRKNVEVMRKMTDFYIRNVLKGRWGEVADGMVVKWSDSDKRQFEKEMWDKCNSYIRDLMELIMIVINCGSYIEMTATDRSIIDKIILALHTLEQENKISYHKEIEWLMNIRKL